MDGQKRLVAIGNGAIARCTCCCGTILPHDPVQDAGITHLQACCRVAQLVFCDWQALDQASDGTQAAARLTVGCCLKSVQLSMQLCMTLIACVL